MTKVLPLLLLLLLTGCASPLVDAPRLREIAAERDFENLYYCGTKHDVHHFTLAREKQFPYHFRLPASEYPLKKPFPKTSNRSAWAPLLVSLYDGTSEFRGVGGSRLPPPPHYQTSSIHHPDWLDQQKWWTGLTNGQLTYQRFIELKDTDHTIVDSFEAARASGKRYHACFRINGIHLLGDAQHKLTNSSQVFYGPDFEWLPDGRLRSKSFHYGNGLKEHHWLDANGRPVCSIYSDHHANTLTMLRYDTSGEVAMRSIGPEQENDPERPAKGEVEYFIGDRKVTQDEFIGAFRKYRSEDIVGNRTQLTK
ncbi:MAG: hypothetical protein K0Q55_209 [Verrucomicrobia bacterium]|jgi:hypothetical protein|nr:hypothetical protein [Verrucomicrobiota bacterium]